MGKNVYLRYVQAYKYFLITWSSNLILRNTNIFVIIFSNEFWFLNWYIQTFYFKSLVIYTEKERKLFNVILALETENFAEQNRSLLIC